MALLKMLSFFRFFEVKQYQNIESQKMVNKIPCANDYFIYSTSQS